MKKLLVIIILLGAAFGAGFYVGRQPPEEVKRHIQELSQEVVDQTVGVVDGVGVVEGDLPVQKKFLQAMSEFLNGKARILDGKPDEAIAELEKTLDSLKQAAKMQGVETSDALLGTMSNIEDLQRSLAKGQAVSQAALEKIQEKLEALLQ